MVDSLVFGCACILFGTCIREKHVKTTVIAKRKTTSETQISFMQTRVGSEISRKVLRKSQMCETFQQLSVVYGTVTFGSLWVPVLKNVEK